MHTKFDEVRPCGSWDIRQEPDRERQRDTERQTDRQRDRETCSSQPCAPLWRGRSNNVMIGLLYDMTTVQWLHCSSCRSINQRHSSHQSTSTALVLVDSLLLLLLQLAARQHQHWPIAITFSEFCVVFCSEHTNKSTTTSINAINVVHRSSDFFIEYVELTCSVGATRKCSSICLC